MCIFSQISLTRFFILESQIIFSAEYLNINLIKEFNSDWKDLSKEFLGDAETRDPETSSG